MRCLVTSMWACECRRCNWRSCWRENSPLSNRLPRLLVPTRRCVGIQAACPGIHHRWFLFVCGDANEQLQPASLRMSSLPCVDQIPRPVGQLLAVEIPNLILMGGDWRQIDGARPKCTSFNFARVGLDIPPKLLLCSFSSVHFHANSIRRQNVHLRPD